MKFYSEQQVKLAIEQVRENIDRREKDFIDGEITKDEFLEYLSLTDDMEGVQHSLEIESGAVL